MKPSQRWSHTPSIALLFLAPWLPSCAVADIDGQGAPDEEGTARQDALSGQRTTLWIHGRSSGSPTTVGAYDDFGYWGPAADATGASPKAVGWGGVDYIATSNGAVRDALDCFCTGERACYAAVHSAGEAQLGYALAYYGDSERPITNGVPDAFGRCEPTGETQKGWTVLWVDVAAGAAGGSELGDLGSWAVGDNLASDMRVSTARALYDHNETRGITFYRFAGARGKAYAALLPGQDDGTVSYHAAGGLALPGSFCNPGDPFCDDDLRYGEDGSWLKGSYVPKWAGHNLYFRDDGEVYDHFTRGAWGGIVSEMRADIGAYALPKVKGSARARGALDDFQQRTRYPFGSRPASERLDLLRPNFVAPRQVALSDTRGASLGPLLTLTQDRYDIGPGESAVLRLTCAIGARPTPCQVDTALVSLGATPVTTALFHPREDGSAELVIDPETLGLGAHFGAIRVEAAVRVGSARGVASFDLTSTPKAPALLTGQVREALEQGSLALYVGVEVLEAGRYVLRARGDDARGRRFAYLSESAELGAGQREMRLSVFGKLVRDSGALGPFSLADVELFRLREDTTPDRERAPTWEGVMHVTRAYPSSAFSSDAWQDPMKERVLRALRSDVAAE